MLNTYWPGAAQVNACIKNEAETADVAVLLAVHQPSPLSTRDVGSNLATAVTEEDLLNAFLTDNVPEGRLVLPITGASGAGKSHMIRWLDAQLRRSPQRDRLHIIRIPKSASLRTVVELILEPLKDNPRYAQARGELTRAVAEVDVSTAVVTFRAHLENALKDIRAKLEAEYRENPQRRELLPKIGHARDLPWLFADAALSDHFADKVLSRIVERALKGRAETNSEEDDRKTQFTPEDLVLPPEVNLGDAAQAVRNYFQRNLASADPSKVRVAVDLLNEAIDPAIGNVFQLQQTTGGMTLQDIILAVRATLLEEGKDLVLLIEDFAALSGIQDVLLKVCIQEGTYGGKKVRATMRTAVALTDGVLSFRDTIFTRAQKEWIVGGREMTDAQIKDATVELVGAYLNAARWGENDLQRLFHDTGSARENGHWLPVWRDDNDDDHDQALLDAFGYSRSGTPLFPFNRYAISVMADAHLTKNGALVFNPRKVINELLRSTLLLRGMFEANAFPSADQRSFTPNAWLAGWIRLTNQGEAVRKRLASFLSVWGGNPLNEGELARLAPGLFKAFHLPTPDLFGVEGDGSRDGDGDNGGDGDGSGGVGGGDGGGDGGGGGDRGDTPKRVADPWAAQWLKTLDAWSGGTPLPQGEAREVRNALGAMLENAMEWPRLRMRKRPITANSIVIPNARGNLATTRALHVCASSSDEDGRIRAGIMGSLRYQKNGRHWSYAEADDDYVASSALVDHLVEQVEPLLLKDAEQQVRLLARGLLTQARVAGLSPPTKATAVSGTLEGLFAPLPLRVSQEFDEGWDRLREATWSNLDGQPARSKLQTALKDLISAYQGIGSTPFAFDSVRLLESLTTADTPESTSEGLAPDITTYLRQFGEGRIWTQLQALISKLGEFRKDLSGYVDESFNKAVFVKELQDVSRLLVTTATWPSCVGMPKDFQRQLEEFQAAPIIELFNKTAIVNEASAEDIPKVLNALGSLDLSNIHLTKSFLQAVETIVSAAQNEVEQKHALYNQADPDRIAEEIDGFLLALSGDDDAATIGDHA